MPDGGFADPFKLTLGFLSAAIKRGARVYERSSVNKITFTRKTATAFLNERRHHHDQPRDLHRRADQPVQAAEAAPAPRASLCRAHRTVVGRGPRGTGPARRDAARHRIARRTICGSPPITARLFAGGDQKRQPDRLRDKTLVQRTGELMYELTRLYPAISGARPEYGWDVPLAHPVDGVPYAGSHRNFPFQLFAFGTSHDPGPRVSREPDHPAQHSRQARKRRRALFIC